MKIKQPQIITPEELGEKLFLIHTHAEIVFDQNPNQIVYREKDIIELLKELGFTEPKF
ncbi:MAG: hypothetical protein ABIP51_05090 [Bacteroidia bacterium]